MNTNLQSTNDLNGGCMSKTVQFYEDDTILAEEDTSRRFMKVIWLRHPSSAQFREAALRIVHFILDRHIQYFLSDNRKVQYLDLSDQNFLYHTVYSSVPKKHTLFVSYILNQAS